MVAAAVVVRMGITMLEIMVNMKHVVDIMKLLFMTMVATILPTTPSERRVAARHAQSLFSLVFATLSGMTTTMVVMLMLAALRASSWP